MTANYNFIGFIVPHGTCTKDINYHVYSPPSTTQEQVDNTVEIQNNLVLYWNRKTGHTLQ